MSSPVPLACYRGTSLRGRNQLWILSVCTSEIVEFRFEFLQSLFTCYLAEDFILCGRVGVK